MPSITATNIVSCVLGNNRAEMTDTLKTAFADAIDRESAKARLGYATTAQLLDEIRARCEVNGTIDYSTVKAPD